MGLVEPQRARAVGGDVLIVQNKLNPSVVLDEIAAGIPDDANELFVAAAYVTRTGSDLLFDRLRRRLGNAAFNQLPKHLVTTGDFGLTQPEAIDAWIGLGARVDIANATGIALGNLNPAIAYHPKVYAFKSAAGDWQVVCGSANLTARGLTINSEAVTRISLSDAAARSIIELLSEGAVAATPELIATYRNVRVANPPPPQVAQEISPVPPPPNLPQLTAFGDAVNQGEVDPVNHSRFWVQTLTMSGGSGSQLELPRGANSFFGFQFTDHVAGDKVTIGRPVLLSGRGRWSDRILSWHGNNQMERINMPTLAMGGYDYAKSAVSFLRTPKGFEFSVAPWDSDLARSWRVASAQAGRTYKLGENSPRLCGLVE